MKKIIYLLMIIPIVFASCEVEEIDTETVEAVYGKGKLKSSDLVFEMDGCSGDVRNLIAGQNTVVGTVKVTVDNLTDEYVITYDVTEADWCLTEYQIDVEQTPYGFPVGNTGNPKIGNFEFKDDQLGCETNVEVRVPISKGTWIAAHGVVVCSTNSVESLLANLPETVDFCTDVQGPDVYLNISIESGALAGDYGSWCVDNDLPISINNCYDGASIYTSTGDLPEGAFEYPENFDMVNWFLNQDIVGTESPNGLGAYTYGDLQFAIWYLLDDVERPDGSDYGLGDFSADRVAELVTLAQENGDGYSPECGDNIGIIISLDQIQPLIIPYPLECSPCDETVWAEGCDFPGNSWAMYFEFMEE